MSLETVALCIAWSIVPITLGLYFWWVKGWTIFGLLLIIFGYCLGSYAGIQLQGLEEVPTGLTDLWSQQVRYVNIWFAVPFFALTLFEVARYWGRKPVRAYLAVGVFLFLVLGINYTLSFFLPL